MKMGNNELVHGQAAPLDKQQVSLPLEHRPRWSRNEGEPLYVFFTYIKSFVFLGCIIFIGLASFSRSPPTIVVGAATHLHRRTRCTTFFSFFFIFLFTQYVPVKFHKFIGYCSFVFFSKLLSSFCTGTVFRDAELNCHS